MRKEIKGKKGSDPFSILITVLGMIALTLAMMFILAKGEAVHRELGNPGDDALLIFETYNQVDTALLYLDTSAKRSLERAIYCFMKSGLKVGGSCRAIVKWSYGKDPPRFCIQRRPYRHEYIDIRSAIPDPLNPALLIGIFKTDMDQKITAFNDKLDSESEIVKSQIKNNYIYSFDTNLDNTDVTGIANKSYLVNRKTPDPQLGEFAYKANLSFIESVTIPRLEKDHGELKYVVESLIDKLFATGDDSKIPENVSVIVTGRADGGLRTSTDLDLLWSVSDPVDTGESQCNVEFGGCTVQIKVSHGLGCSEERSPGQYDNFYRTFYSNFSIKIENQLRVVDENLIPQCTFYKWTPEKGQFGSNPPLKGPCLSPVHRQVPGCSRQSLATRACLDPIRPPTQNDHEYRFRMYWKKYSVTKCCAHTSRGYVCQVRKEYCPRR